MRLVANVVRVMFWFNSVEIPLDENVGCPWIFHQLAIVVHIVYAGEDLFKISQSELFFFEL